MPTMDEQQLINTAISQYKEKQYASAIDTLSHVIYNDMENRKAQYILALCYMYTHENERALYYFKEASYDKNYRFKARKHMQELSKLTDKYEVDNDTEKVMRFKVFRSDINFDAVAGSTAQKTYLKEHVIDVIKHRDTFREYGKKLSAGVIFYGPPGNGKTYMARALAGEASTFMIAIKINQILGQYVGVPEKNISTLFKQANMQSPCIIFIDEIDALGSSRSQLSGGDEQGGTMALKMAVNSLLEHIDGIEKNNEGIFIIGATNRPWDLDSALTRPGRIEDIVYMGLPDSKTRTECFKINMRNKKNVQTLDYGRLARATIGLSNADINAICENATNTQVHKKISGKNDAPLLTTHDLLREIRKHTSSTMAWFAETQKEILGRVKTEIVNGRKIVTKKEGKLTPEELVKYSAMTKDMRKFNSVKYKMHMKMTRFTSLYLW